MEGWLASASEKLVALQRKMSVVIIFAVPEKGPVF
jgi:hypothetical protein